MNKRIYIGVAIITITLIFIFMIANESKPITMVENAKSINSMRINDRLITDKRTVNEIIQLLDQFETTKTVNPFPMETNKCEIELNYKDNQKPRHISLGEINIIYESGNKTIYKIIDGDNLLIEMRKYLLPEH